MRDILYKNAEITKLFNEETIHVIDYDCEYDREIDVQKFPEYNNKTWSRSLFIFISVIFKKDSSILIPV